MTSHLIALALKNRIFIVLAFALVAVLGVQATRTLPIDAFPEISPTQVSIIFKAPGMTTEAIEQQVTHPIETELLGIPQQRVLRSTTKYGITSITLDFKEGTDIYWARQQVAEKIASIRDSLPANLNGGIAPLSTPLGEMFMFTIEHPSFNNEQKRHLLDWVIRPALRTVEGVADVTNLGGKVRTIQFTADHGKLLASGIQLQDIERSVRENNALVSVGRVEVGTETFSIQLGGPIQSLDDFRQLRVGSAHGQSHTLGTLGQVDYSYLPPLGGITKDGKDAVQGLVVALKGANAAAVVAGIEQKMKQLETSLPDGTELNVFYNRKDLIHTALSGISMALLQAIALVIGILFFFLRNFRAALLVSISIPIATLFSIIALKFLGISANLMSLGGLVIAIGMIVDSSVVLVEKFETELKNDSTRPKMYQLYRASISVVPSIISGTIVIILVFLPLMLLTGLEGKLFAPVAITIALAISGALITALLLIPALASFVLKPRSHQASPLMSLQRAYRTLLSMAITHSGKSLSAFIGLLLCSLVAFSMVGKIFMPTMNEGDIVVQVEKAPSVSLAESLAIDKQLELRLLQEVPEIIQVIARTGSDELGLDPMSLNETDIFMQLAPREQWTVNSKEQLIHNIRNVLNSFSHLNLTFTQPIQMRISEMLTGSTGDVSIKIYGNEISSLSTLAQRITELTTNVEGAVDVQTSVIDGARYLHIEPEFQRLAEVGLSKTEFNAQLAAQLSGYEVGTSVNGRIRTPIIFGNQRAQANFQSIETLNDFRVITPDLQEIPVKELATLTFQQGPSLIERENGSRFAVVTMNVSGRDLVGFVEEAKQLINRNVPLPAGYFVEYGGEFENQARANATLMLILPLTLLLIVVILYNQLKSLKLTAIVLTNIPFALSGGALGLWLTGAYMSVPASVGFITLMGVAILNGVVMISHFQQLAVYAKDQTDYILGGAVDRLRPILITAMTAILGLIPLLLASGPGSEIQKPLAIVVVSGLITATVATLILIPLLYQRFHKEISHAR